MGQEGFDNSQQKPEFIPYENLPDSGEILSPEDFPQFDKVWSDAFNQDILIDRSNPEEPRVFLIAKGYLWEFIPEEDGREDFFVNDKHQIFATFDEIFGPDSGAQLPERPPSPGPTWWLPDGDPLTPAPSPDPDKTPGPMGAGNEWPTANEDEEDDELVPAE